MNEYLADALIVLQPLLLAALTWLAAAGARWVRGRVQDEYLQGLLLRLDDAIYDVVSETQHTVVAAIKKAKSDGKIDAEEAKKIKDDAVSGVLAYLGKKGVKELHRVVDSDALEAMIRAKIENVVKEVKGDK